MGRTTAEILQPGDIILQAHWDRIEMLTVLRPLTKQGRGQGIDMEEFLYNMKTGRTMTGEITLSKTQVNKIKRRNINNKWEMMRWFKIIFTGNGNVGFVTTVR